MKTVWRSAGKGVEDGSQNGPGADAFLMGKAYKSVSFFHLEKKQLKWVVIEAREKIHSVENVDRGDFPLPSQF